jgi:2-hydroxychromene-2-carboxylate isomerase
VADLKRAVQGRLVEAALSEPALRLRRRLARIRRRVSGATRTVEVFYRADDPYSHLLLTVMPDVADGYDVDVRLHVLPAAAADPQADLRRAYAARDGVAVARATGIPMAAAPPANTLGLAVALHRLQRQEASLAEIAAVSAAWWSGDAAAMAGHVERLRALDRNRADVAARASLERLIELGHYDAGMSYYAGEWYWGLDRLRHLTRRLRGAGAVRGAGAAARDRLDQRLQALELPLRDIAGLAPLARRCHVDCFFSFRSPYSWIALERLYALVDALGVELRMRPVLPMVARGVPLSPAKRRYILFDAAREARRWGVPFGRIVDPLGEGVERCQAAFVFAAGQGAERALASAAGQAIWSRGIDVATDAGLNQVLDEAGLSVRADAVRRYAGDWREPVQRNQQALRAAGLWGVPSMVTGEAAVWGQDRLWRLHDALTGADDVQE